MVSVLNSSLLHSTSLAATITIGRLGVSNANADRKGRWHAVPAVWPPNATLQVALSGRLSMHPDVRFRSTFRLHIHVCWFCSVPSVVLPFYGYWESGTYGCFCSICHSVFLF